MTLNTTYKPAVAEGNGIIKEFSYSFNPLSLSYIKVYFEIDGKWVEQKTGWSATVSDSGGVVTFLTAPTTRVSIERDIPESQQTSYTTSSGFQAKVIENSFDLLTGMIQELKDASDRSVKVEVGDNQTPEELLEEVYNKLDSATEIAGDAINAANQAQTAADNATAAVEAAEKQVIVVTEYIDEKKLEIDTIVAEAEASVDDAITQATEDVKQAALEAAQESIKGAAEQATAIVIDYANNEVKPQLNEIASNAEADAANAAESAELAANESGNAAISATDAQHYAEDSRIWAEGSDSEVKNVDGEHSSKVWSEMAKTSATSAASSADLARQYGNDKINQTHITNCITEIPQDIKLELNSGVISAKAGSKIRYPNGKNADGSLRFDEIVLESDLTYTNAENQRYMLFYTPSSNTLNGAPLSNTASGTTVPTTGDSVFYDTDDNTLGFYKNGVLQATRSFPLAIITANTTQVASIDQVFNGFGYIGSTIFALPGVSGLIPNYRNPDGSLKNIEITLDEVKIQNRTDWGSNLRYFWLGSDGKLKSVITSSVTYDAERNKNYNITDNTAVGLICGEVTSVDGRITSIAPKTAFHALDYNDFYNELNNKFKVVSTLPANPVDGTFYYIPE